MGDAKVKRAGARARGVDLWFPTPIYSATLANRRWNAGLTREIYRLREHGHVPHGSMSERAAWRMRRVMSNGPREMGLRR